MKELRRLLIKTNRLTVKDAKNNVLLEKEESHYLKRVLRMEKGNRLEIINGEGSLWEAIFDGHQNIKLCTPYTKPKEKVSNRRPLIGLAIVLPKNGFDNVLRMSCEIGVDIIQPLISTRCLYKNQSYLKTNRWNSIIKEAIEQSERLSAPELKAISSIESWIKEININSEVAIGTTRKSKLKNCKEWLAHIGADISQVWIAIGPEGGWTNEEEANFISTGCKIITLGGEILRTSTAAIVATTLMVEYRNTSTLCE